MSTHRFVVRGPRDAVLDTQIVAGTAAMVARDFGYVDIALTDDGDLPDLTAFMEDRGYEFVETDPQLSPQWISILGAEFPLVEQLAPGATPTVDWTTSIKQRLVLSANITGLTFTPPPGPTNLILQVRQPAGNNFTVAGWPAAVQWPGGVAPTITAANGAHDTISFFYDGAVYEGQYAQNFQ